jgi:penicillin-binding protein 2
MTLGRTRFRCWNRYGHGETNLLKSITQSCDVYYYNLATRVSIDRLAAFASEFGIGRKSGIELPGERSGLMPSSSWKLKNIHDQWYTGDTLSVCIGQGYLTATPLQIAAMYMVLANGGTYLQPHLLKDTGAKGVKVDVNDKNMRIIRKALWQVVNTRRGTAHRSKLNSNKWEMAGKTGTAQVVKQHLETLKKVADTPWRFRDHAWFAAFAPFTNPEIAIAVLIEHGGHGGSTAAPIARQTVEFYLNKLDGLKK